MSVTADPTIHRQVVSAARELLSQEPNAPISRIASEAGVSRATVYRHFGSREALLRTLEIEPPLPAEDRLLLAAAELIKRGGLHAFSMEELATAAGVSRATVYRIVPTKAALFGELVRRFSPFESVVGILDQHGHEASEVVIPLLTRTLARVGAERIGVMRAILLEASAVTPEAMMGVQPFMPETVRALAGYMQREMAAGRVRPMHPVLAVQAVLGPIFVHLLTRPIAERLIGFDLPLEAAVDQLTESILGGLRS
jgi:AcrR family transcriptional regulator